MRFHSWYRGRVETLDAKYNLAYINSTLCGYTKCSKRVKDLKTRYLGHSLQLSLNPQISLIQIRLMSLFESSVP